ncbi:MAG: hypothetical protein ONB44_03490 [candidate division KSB1 bacterium]|nr:hypothetical protein [candidate division KSB1 bacterium]MDZ7301191.1 hypothetical protein [candidate division KSB1 bacterium]MDZ7310585.1 hypothetical protein [candidate division KSB1 bacterium]
MEVCAWMFDDDSRNYQIKIREFFDKVMLKPFRLILFALFLMPQGVLAQEEIALSATPLPSSHFIMPRLVDEFSPDTITVNLSNSPTIGGAFIRSLVIPGWGQRRAGAKTAARNFFVAEVILWSGFTAFEVYGNWVKSDYKLFASTHAGAAVAGKDDQFFVDMGNFISVDEFNQNRLRRRDVEGLYDPVKYFWRWDSDANRQRFFNMRKRSDKYFSRAELIVAGVIANHLISGIHASWVAHKKSSEKNEQRGELNVPLIGVVTSPEEIRLIARLEF